MIALVEDRPIPLIRDDFDSLLNPKSPYGDTYGIMIDGSIQLWRHRHAVYEIHPDGTRYIWHNPVYLLSAIARGDSDVASLGSVLNVFRDGSFKGRIDARNYVWGPPVLRTMPKEVPVLRVYDEVPIDYSRGPHAVSCRCCECFHAVVKPIYYKTYDTCNCTTSSCNNGYCAKCCGCNMCYSSDDDTRSSVSSDSYMNSHE